MARPALTDGSPSGRWTSERYLDLVNQGVLGEDDRVELLEGVIVAVAPPNPRHSAAVSRANRALIEAIGRRAAIRVQDPVVAGRHSVPQPDVLVGPGCEADYDTRHPTEALLVVEVADSSLAQDRLTKAAIYAAAGVPEYWLVNLRHDHVEVFRGPDRKAKRYRVTSVAHSGERLTLVAFPDASVAVADLLPRR